VQSIRRRVNANIPAAGLDIMLQRRLLLGIGEHIAGR